MTAASLGMRTPGVGRLQAARSRVFRAARKLRPDLDPSEDL
jgi:hypothetical protein